MKGGGISGWEVCKKREGWGGGGHRGTEECHKATAVQGCLSLQGSTPLLSW